MTTGYTICPFIYVVVLKEKQKHFIFIDFARMLFTDSLIFPPKLIWILFQRMSAHKDEKCKTTLLEILILNLKLLRINGSFQQRGRGNGGGGCCV